MPLFVCSKCQCAENTALTDYWWHVQREKKPALCSACHPHIRKWHGRFAQRSAIGWSITDDGFIWSPEEVAAGKVPPSLRIVGIVEHRGAP